MVVRLPNVMVVNPSFPAETLPAFITYAKSHPGKINMASSTIGGADHLAGALFSAMAAIEITNVPYRGGGTALFADLLSGQVDVNFATLPGVISYIRGNKLRALAVTTETRHAALPDIHTISDFLPRYEASSWHGVGTPKATSAEVIDKLNNQINAILADAAIKARLAQLGGTPLPGSPSDFRNLIAGETDKWGKVIQAANIKPE